MKKSLLVLSILLSLNPGRSFAQRVINIDFNKSAGKLNTMFKECVGAGRANEGLRADCK